MTAEDFAAWLAAISGMSSGQRAEAFATLEKAGASGAEAMAEPSGQRRGKRGRREDALGTTSLERVEAQGCPHCAGHEIVGWGRSHGLLRFRCKSCGRTFNGLTKTPMAHLRKKEKWPAHARAMIEGKSLAKTAQLCGVHPTTAFRWRHRFLRAPAANNREA
jgi:transposase-like protein